LAACHLAAHCLVTLSAWAEAVPSTARATAPKKAEFKQKDLRDIADVSEGRPAHAAPDEASFAIFSQPSIGRSPDRKRKFRQALKDARRSTGFGCGI
jgi:hypothetical protein